MSNNAKALAHAAASLAAYMLFTGGSVALSLALLSLFDRPPLAMLPVALALCATGIYLSSRAMDALDEIYKRW